MWVAISIFLIKLKLRNVKYFPILRLMLGLNWVTKGTKLIDNTACTLVHNSVQNVSDYERVFQKETIM